MRTPPNAQPGIETFARSPFDTTGALPPLSRAAMAAVVAAVVLMLGTATIGAVLLNHDTRTSAERVKADGFSFAPPAGWEDNPGTTQEAIDGRVSAMFQRMAADAGTGSSRAVDVFRKLHSAVVDSEASARTFRSFIPAQYADRLAAGTATSEHEEVEADRLVKDIATALPYDNPDKTLDTMIAWGRYAGLMDLNPKTGMVFVPRDEEAPSHAAAG